MIVYLASNNAHKCEEIRDLLRVAEVDIDLRSAQDLGEMPPVEESEDSFEGNARLKATALAAHLADDAFWALADDSGLEVEALDGAPGVHSARFAGTHGDDAANNNRLLDELEGVAPDKRNARFRCVLVLRNRLGDEEVYEGTCEGSIAERMAGEHGFGYDPLFIPEGQHHTFAELGPEVKAQLSHRARAIAAWIAATGSAPPLRGWPHTRPR